MTAYLRCLGQHVSIGTVDRLMRDERFGSVIRECNHRTTIAAKDGKRAGDLVDRNFTAPSPNRVCVVDFTYCRAQSGFVYVSFIIHVFSRKIVGWHVMTTRPTELVTLLCAWRCGMGDMKVSKYSGDYSIIPTPDRNTFP